MGIYCSNIKLHQNEVESYVRNVAQPLQRSCESAPILNGEQPDTIEDSEVALNDPGCVARAHHTAALSGGGHLSGLR